MSATALLQTCRNFGAFTIGNNEDTIVSLKSSLHLEPRLKMSFMSLWRDSDAIRTFAGKLPPWIKRPARRILQLADRIFRHLGLTVAAHMQFPTSGIILGRETIVLIVH